MKTIYLFRHGEVEDAYRDRVRGAATDCLLSPDGERMSIANAQFLIECGVKEIITTGMRRTDFVGEFLSKNHAISHSVDTRLREMHMGKWEGRLLKEVNAAHPEEALRFVADPLSGVFPDLEDVTLYQNRVLEAWQDILDTDSEQLAVIAHGITNSVILSAITQTRYPLKQTIGCMNEISICPIQLKRHNVILY